MCGSSSVSSTTSSSSASSDSGAESTHTEAKEQDDVVPVDEPPTEPKNTDEDNMPLDLDECMSLFSFYSAVDEILAHEKLEPTFSTELENGAPIADADEPLLPFITTGTKPGCRRTNVLVGGDVFDRSKV